MTDVKNKNFEKLVAPKLFFCTFMHEQAYEKAVGANFELFAETTKIRQATEPTDIIWENRQIRRSQR